MSSSASPLLVVGSIGLDTVETRAGKKTDVLGGAASYFSVAASFLAPVRLTGVVGTVPEVNDLEGIGKIQMAHILQPDSSINEQDHFSGLAHVPPDSFLAQEGTKVLYRSHAGNISRRFIVSHRTALFIAFVLREDTAQVGGSGFGTAVGLFARPSF